MFATGPTWWYQKTTTKHRDSAAQIFMRIWLKGVGRETQRDSDRQRQTMTKGETKTVIKGDRETLTNKHCDKRR